MFPFTDKDAELERRLTPYIGMEALDMDPDQAVVKLKADAKLKEDEIAQLQEKHAQDVEMCETTLRPALNDAKKAKNKQEKDTKMAVGYAETAKLRLKQKAKALEEAQDNVNQAIARHRDQPAELEEASAAKLAAAKIRDVGLELFQNILPDKRVLASKNKPSAELIAKVAGIKSVDHVLDLPRETTKDKEIGLLERAYRVTNLGFDLGIKVNTHTSHKELRQAFIKKCFFSEVPEHVKKVTKPDTSPRSWRAERIRALFSDDFESEAKANLTRTLEGANADEVMSCLSQEVLDSIVASATKRRRTDDGPGLVGSTIATLENSTSAASPLATGIHPSTPAAALSPSSDFQG